MTYRFDDTLGIDHDDPADAITTADMAALAADHADPIPADHMADLTDAIMADEDADDLDAVLVTAAHRQAARDAKTDAAQVDGLGRRAIRDENRDATRFAGVAPLAMIDPVMIDAVTGAAGTVAMVATVAVLVWVLIRHLGQTWTPTVEIDRVAGSLHTMSRMVESVLAEMLDLNAQVANMDNGSTARRLEQTVRDQDNVLEGIREVCDDLSHAQGGMNQATRTAVEVIRDTVFAHSATLQIMDARMEGVQETADELTTAANDLRDRSDQIKALCESIDGGSQFTDADQVAMLVVDSLDIPSADDIASLLDIPSAEDIGCNVESVDEDMLAACVIDALDSRDRIDADALAEGVASELAKRLACPAPGTASTITTVEAMRSAAQVDAPVA